MGRLLHCTYCHVSRRSLPSARRDEWTSGRGTESTICIDEIGSYGAIELDVTETDEKELDVTGGERETETELSRVLMMQETLDDEEKGRIRSKGMHEYQVRGKRQESREQRTENSQQKTRARWRQGRKTGSNGIRSESEFSQVLQVRDIKQRQWCTSFAPLL